MQPSKKDENFNLIIYDYKQEDAFYYLLLFLCVKPFVIVVDIVKILLKEQNKQTNKLTKTTQKWNT